MPRLSAILAALLVLSAGSSAGAQDAGGTQADAEHMLQDYLAIWSDDARITSDTVSRYYAPLVTYYGHSFSRAQVLADKQAFVRSYPRRSYREVPGTFVGSCSGDRSLCRVTAVVEWRRTDRHGAISAGRARLAFDFVPVDGGRKIAREGALPLERRTEKAAGDRRMSRDGEAG